METANNLYHHEAMRVLRQGTRRHYVYFILATCEDEEFGHEMPPLVKIGTSTDVQARLTNLLRGDNTKGADWLDVVGGGALQLMGYVEGDRELESLLHKSLAEHRAGGEWFYYNDAVAEVIDHILDEHCCCDLCEWTDALHSLPVEVQREIMQPVWESMGLAPKAAS